MRKQGSKRQKLSHHLQMISSPIAERAMSDESYAIYMATIIATEPERSLERWLTMLLEKPRYRATHNAFATRLEDIGSNSIYRDKLTLERILMLVMSNIIYSSEKINSFWKIRDNFERALIISDYEAANAALNQCLEEHGESIWYVRNRILLLSYNGKKDELKRYCEECKKRTSESFIATLLNYFQLISDTDDAYLLLRSLVIKNVQEFKEANVHELASLLSILFSPDPLTIKNTYVSCIGRFQIFPVIDQYMLLIEVLQHSVAELVCTGKAQQLNLVNALEKLSACILDPLLQRALNFLNGKISQNLSEAGGNLLQLYEIGNYPAVVDYYKENINNISNPIAYINLVAKSYAYMGVTPDPRARNIIDDLLVNLAQLYILPSPNPHSEDTVISRAVKLKSLTQWPYIQLALFVALPQKYPEQDAKLASAKALLVNGEATPLIHGLLESVEPSFGLRYGITGQGGSTKYRNLKREICRAINKGEDQSRIDRLFDDFRNETPLEKEYFELYSEYCLYVDRYDDLIKTCANAVVQDQEVCQCFPMQALVDRIEENGLVSIEVLILLFAYVNRISQAKDYLLNEVFEELIYASGFKRPSELLASKIELTPLEIVLFKDVCIPEIMDFLGCFISVIELRAERVRILDILLERRLIDSATRMIEVEEIIEQLFVESAVSELNSAKIYVDDIALRKKHYEATSSLVNLYHQAKDDGDDRITFFEQDNFSDASRQAYLSGNKNSIALKIINVCIDAFLYDEKYGLDKNLSTEIRHGYFSNLVRSKLEEKNLITEADGTGKYKTNEYWRNENIFVAEDVWQKVDAELANFSKSFNALISEAEGWMNIKSSQNEPERFFSYNLDVGIYWALRKQLDRSKNTDEVLANIFNYLWKKTEKQLKEMRERINVEFRAKIDALFDTLISGITQAKRGAALAELMGAINQTKNEIREDISKSAEWFRRVSRSGMSNNTLDIVINIAVNTYKDVKGQGIFVSSNLPEDFKKIIVQGRSVKPFIIALINLIDNCLRHSGLGNATVVKITGGITNNRVNIFIKNSLSEDKYTCLVNHRLDEIRASALCPNETSLLRKEGGTGIAKARDHISFISESSIINFSLDSGYFVATIEYDK